MGGTWEVHGSHQASSDTHRAGHATCHQGRYGARTTAGTGVVQGWWRWPRAGGGGPGLVSGPGLVQGWWGRGSSGCKIDTGQGHGQGGHRAKERAWSEEMRAPRLATCGMRHSVQSRAHVRMRTGQGLMPLQEWHAPGMPKRHPGEEGVGGTGWAVWRQGGGEQVQESTHHSELPSACKVVSHVTDIWRVMSCNRRPPSPLKPPQSLPKHAQASPSLPLMLTHCSILL